MSTPAGWYDDGSGRRRWFDGIQWTEHVQDVVQEPPVLQRSGLVLAGGIIAVIRGLAGTVLTLTTLPTIEVVEPFSPGFGALIMFEVVVMIATFVMGIWAIVSSRKPTRAHAIKICGIVIIAVSAIDLVWGIALLGATAGTLGTGVGLVVAVGLIGGLLIAGSRRLAKQV
jgi:hypothetical protein